MTNSILILTPSHQKKKKPKIKLIPTQIEVCIKNIIMLTPRKALSAIKLTKYVIKPTRPRIHKLIQGTTHFSTIQAFLNQHRN